MRSTSTHALASTLANALAEGQPIIDITYDGTPTQVVLDAIDTFGYALQDLIAARRPLGPARGGSLTEMLARMRARAVVADHLRDTLVPLLGALEAAGLTLDLLPGLVAADPFAEPEPALAGAQTGIELCVRPLPAGRIA